MLLVLALIVEFLRFSEELTTILTVGFWLCWIDYVSTDSILNKFAALPDFLMSSLLWKSDVLCAAT